MDRDARERYWKANRNLIALLLAIWALVSFGFAIFLARPLESVTVGSLPMGFWWAQQGSMLVFVVLIFVYARRMDTLDERYDVDEEDSPRRRRGGRRSKAVRSGRAPAEGPPLQGSAPDGPDPDGPDPGGPDPERSGPNGAPGEAGER